MSDPLPVSRFRPLLLLLGGKRCIANGKQTLTVNAFTPLACSWLQPYLLRFQGKRYITHESRVYSSCVMRSSYSQCRELNHLPAPEKYQCSYSKRLTPTPGALLSPRGAAGLSHSSGHTQSVRSTRHRTIARSLLLWASTKKHRSHSRGVFFTLIL